MTTAWIVIGVVGGVSLIAIGLLIRAGRQIDRPRHQKMGDE